MRAEESDLVEPFDLCDSDRVDNLFEGAWDTWRIKTVASTRSTSESESPRIILLEVEFRLSSGLIWSSLRLIEVASTSDSVDEESRCSIRN